MTGTDAEIAGLLDSYGITPVYREDKVDGSDVASITLEEAGSLIHRLAAPKPVDVGEIEDEFGGLDSKAIEEICAKQGISVKHTWLAAQALFDADMRNLGAHGQVVMGVDVRHIRYAIAVLSALAGRP